MLKESRKGKYNQNLEKVIKDIKKSGFHDIRADYESYDSPATLTSQDSDLAYVPDATAKNRLGHKFYFEISNKISETSSLIHKWKLLDTLARLRQGSLKIFVPHGTMRFTQELVNRHNIQAELVKL